MLSELSPQAAMFYLNAANTLYLVCYAVKDVLWLRIFCVVAMLTIVPYYLWGTETVQWGCIWWQVAFLSLNMFWIVVIMKERRPPKMTAQEKELYDDVFAPSCQPQEMLRLLSVAEHVVHDQDNVIVSKLSSPDSLLLIEKGKVNVVVDGKLLATLGRGDFVCEMSFLTGEPAVADVIAASKVEVVSWKRENVNKLFEGRPDLKSVLHEIIGRDLVGKITSAEDKLPELSVDTVVADG